MINSNCIILRGTNREYYVRTDNKKVSTDLGIIDLSNISDLNDGDIVYTHLGTPFTVLIPRFTDIYTHGKRNGAPMMPKDIGIVIAYTGMSCRDRVLDAGTGSGIAAIYFGGIAKNVVTCEVRNEFAPIINKNIQDIGLTNIEYRSCDVLDVSDGPFDIVHLDMMIEPKHIEHTYNLLKNGGYLATYTPFLEQTFCIVDVAKRLFGDNTVKTFECMERELTRTKRGTRPSTNVAHTGYITIARK